MENKQEEMINKFKSVGIQVRKGKRQISNESYSGIISNSEKILEIKIPKK
jgi:hypothetical protein